MFECKCGQIARSQFEFDRHPRGRFCDATPVRAELEERPEEFEEKSGNITRYPKVRKEEVFK